MNQKGKEKYLYSAFIQRLLSRRSHMDHAVLPANYTMPAFPEVRESHQAARRSVLIVNELGYEVRLSGA